MAEHTWIATVLLAGIVSLVGTGTDARAEHSTTGVQQSLRKHFPQLPAGTRVEPTAVQGLYALRVPGFTGCGPYVDGDVKVIANNGNRSWTRVGTGQTLGEAELRSIHQRIRAALPAQAPIVRAGPSLPTAILITAVDCPSCHAVEQALGRQGASYRMVPTGLQRSSTLTAADAACSADPVGAWADARRGKAPDRRSESSCAIDPVAMKDLSCMVNGGSVPTLLMPDGRTSRSGQEIPAMLHASSR